MTVTFTDDVAPAADAATVLVLREGDGAPEVFLVRRSADARFMGGAYVFPGGRVDPGDADPAVPCDLGADEAAARLNEADPARARALFVAAIRECVEEAGILLASGEVSPAVLAALRARGAPPIATLLPPGVTLRARELVPFARWVTPTRESRRFDARFFLARAPAGADAARHDGRETVASCWLTASAALERARAGEVVLAPPTWRTLSELRAARTVDEALALAPARVTPREPVVVFGDEIAVLLPDDPGHPSYADPAAPGQPTRFGYLDGAWIPR